MKGSQLSLIRDDADRAKCNYCGGLVVVRLGVVAADGVFHSDCYSETHHTSTGRAEGSGE